MEKLAAQGGSRHEAESVSTNFDKERTIKKSLFSIMGHFGHEDELYNVATVKFYSSPRPVGLRPTGRFLSFSVEVHEKPAFGVGCRGPPSSLNF